MNCDLHTHTNYSDGSYTPTALVEEAKEKNLIIALTDHNTASGLPEFLSAAERLGVIAVAGTELSTVHNGMEFHLLGLFIKPERFREIEDLCTEYHLLKEISNLELIEKLNELGYHIDYPSVRRRNVKGNANRAHVGEELVEKGYFSSVTEAFEKVLDEKHGIYVPPRRLELVEAIRFLRGLDAVTVLAHPLKDIDEAGLRAILPELIEAGLLGIETMHSSFNDETIELLHGIAREYGLVESGGSDFHGTAKPDIKLAVGKGNLHIPESVYLGLLEVNKKIKEGKDE